jgi:hypothetical protein
MYYYGTGVDDGGVDDGAGDGGSGDDDSGYNYFTKRKIRPLVHIVYTFI